MKSPYPFLTDAAFARLIENGKKQAERYADPANVDGETYDFEPVAKIFTPFKSCTWLLTEIDPEEPNIAFGLCDLGQGYPEIGSLCLDELAAVAQSVTPIEADRHFKAEKRLSGYAADARQHQQIIA